MNGTGRSRRGNEGWSWWWRDASWRRRQRVWRWYIADCPLLLVLRGLSRGAGPTTSSTPRLPSRLTRWRMKYHPWRVIDPSLRPSPEHLSNPCSHQTSTGGEKEEPRLTFKHHLDQTTLLSHTLLDGILSIIRGLKDNSWLIVWCHFSCWWNMRLSIKKSRRYMKRSGCCLLFEDVSVMYREKGRCQEVTFHDSLPSEHRRNNN